MDRGIHRCKKQKYKDTKIQRYKLPVACNLVTKLILHEVFILMDHLWCRRKVYIR